MLKIEFKDEIYPFNGIDNIRYISRGFILDEENRLSILSVSRDDIFGKLSYIESSGGGIDEGENEDQAIIREIEEETGYKVSIIKKIGVITDYYNLINRKNIQYYYLLKKGEYVVAAAELGSAGIDPISGKSQITFMVFQNGQPIDPGKAPRS